MSDDSYFVHPERPVYSKEDPLESAKEELLALLQALKSLRRVWKNTPLSAEARAQYKRMLEEKTTLEHKIAILQCWKDNQGDPCIPTGLLDSDE